MHGTCNRKLSRNRMLRSSIWCNQMKCYFQGCDENGITKEHIPPRSFFPDGEKNQLLTVKSCVKHNNKKSKDDLYVLAQICMNASPSNRAREVFFRKIAPQLEINNGAFRKMLAKGATPLSDGSVQYNVDTRRFNEFFTALSCGIIFKSNGVSLPLNYSITHVYCSLSSEVDSQNVSIIKELEAFYSGRPDNFMEFGKPDTKNERIYTVETFGIPDFKSSITLVHLFFGKFKVISMLTNKLQTSAVT